MDFDWTGTTSIIIAVVSSSALTALINYIANIAKNRAEIKKIEQDVVSDSIDQAAAIVKTAINLLESVQGERDGLVRDKKELQKINDDLRKQIEKLELNINNIKKK